MSYLERVKVQFNNETIEFPLVNGRLELTTLRKFYPSATGLEYSKNGDTFILNFENYDGITLIENIETYKAYVSDGKLSYLTN